MCLNDYRWTSFDSERIPQDVNGSLLPLLFFSSWQAPHFLDALIPTVHMELYKNAVKLVLRDVGTSCKRKRLSAPYIRSLIRSIEHRKSVEVEETVDRTARTLGEKTLER